MPAFSVVQSSNARSFLFSFLQLSPYPSHRLCKSFYGVSFLLGFTKLELSDVLDQCNVHILTENQIETCRKIKITIK